jgi:predicted phage terminase large subunit-like protein
VHGWHVEAICAHLEAVTRGEITRLLINVPPGSMKSLLVSVLWPAWEWGPCHRPELRYLSTAFVEDAVKRDTRKMRDLVMSEWYQRLWPHVVIKRAAETSFSNTATGSREGSPFGSLTSKRGDRLLVDDPHSIETAESDVERAGAVRRFKEGATNRLNSQEDSAIIVIMQRLHENDISGFIVGLGPYKERGDYVHLRLPMEFEEYEEKQGELISRRCETPWFRDPRAKDGELLCPERFSRAKVEKDFKGIMGSYAYAGQYQQRPAPREGGMFQREWFKDRGLQRHELPQMVLWWRHWDLAATRRKATDFKGARSAGVLMGRAVDGRFVIGDCKVLAKEGAVVKKTINSTAADDIAGWKPQPGVSLPQDPGQAGKVQKEDFSSDLAGYNVRITGEIGDKVARAEPFSAQCENGNVWYVIAPWNAEFFDELCLFPGAARKDIADACSGAFARLIPKKVDMDDGVAGPRVYGRETPRPGYDD